MRAWLSQERRGLLGKTLFVIECGVAAKNSVV